MVMSSGIMTARVDPVHVMDADKATRDHQSAYEVNWLGLGICLGCCHLFLYCPAQKLILIFLYSGLEAWINRGIAV